MTLMLNLTRDEIQTEIPYALICEARYGAVWDTGKRRREWKAQFTEAEREKASRLFRLAHMWYLTKGVPDRVTMSMSTFKLWQKLGEFCYML